MGTYSVSSSAKRKKNVLFSRKIMSPLSHNENVPAQHPLDGFSGYIQIKLAYFPDVWFWRSPLAVNSKWPYDFVLNLFSPASFHVLSNTLEAFRKTWLMPSPSASRFIFTNPNIIALLSWPVQNHSWVITLTQCKFWPVAIRRLVFLEQKCDSPPDLQKFTLNL